MNFSLGQYIPGNSPVHRLDPRLKLSISFALMIITFMLTKPLPLLLLAAFLFGAVALAGLPLKTLLRSLKPIFLLSLFAFVLNSFMGKGPVLFRLFTLAVYEDGVILGLLMVLRLMLLITGTTLFLTHTTSVLVMATAFEDVLKPLRRIGINSHEIAMMMSIALRFIPTIAGEADKIMKAQSSRGANYDDGHLFSRAKGMLTILVPLFVHSIRRAEELALAMEARCYTGTGKRSRLHELVFTAQDRAAGFGIAAWLTVILFCQYMT